MPELRLNPITSEWVIIAKDRAKRPEEFCHDRANHLVGEYLDSCPFCPGNESRTPDEIMRISQNGKWKLRVIPNKFAAVFPEGETRRITAGLKQSANGVGRHEVIIESPRHDMFSACLDLADFVDLLTVYRCRFMAAYEDERIAHVIIFKNHAPNAGTSIQHPHSELIAFPVTPLHLRMQNVARYFEDTGECLMCAIIRDEQRDAVRTVFETDHSITVVPFAAPSPFHMWLFPKRHACSFADISDGEVKDLAKNLKITLLKLDKGLNKPDFNYVLHSERPGGCHPMHFHWYLGIIPRVMQSTGTELGSGIRLNPSIPEEIAEFMRKVKVEPNC